MGLVTDIGGLIGNRLVDSIPESWLRRIAVRFQPNVVEKIIMGDRFDQSLDTQFEATYRKAFESHAFVYTCTTIIAENIAQLPLNVFDRQGDETVRLADHHIQFLLANPNDWISGFDLLYLTVGFLSLTGDCFWWLGHVPGGPAAVIWPLRPDRVTIHPAEGSNKFISHYEYRVGGSTVNYGPESIIHFKYPSFTDDFRGQGHMSPARKAYLNDLWAREWNNRFFKNSGRPPGILSIDQPLRPEVKNEIREDWRKYQEGQENWHRPAILGQGAKYQEVGKSQRDMDFFSGRRFNRDEIASAFKIPPIFVNAYERATFNNAESQQVFLWHQNLIPKTKFLTGTLRRSTHKFLGVERDPQETIFYAFDFTRVPALQRERREQIKNEVEEIKAGRLRINESRARDNLEPLPWGDSWWKPMALVDAEMSAEPEKAIAESRPEAKARRVDRVSAIWRAFVTRADFFERLFSRYVIRLFQDQREITLRNIRRVQSLSAVESVNGGLHVLVDEIKRPIEPGDLDAIIFNLDQAEAVTVETSTPLYERMMKSGGTAALESVGGGTFDMADPLALQHMREKQQLLARKVNKTTWDAVKDRIVFGMSEGESTLDIARGIESVFDDRLQNVQRIARTEVQGALNGGYHDGLKQSRKVKEKTWITAGDEAVREAHQNVDSITIGIDQRFKLTNRDGTPAELEYPGDPAGGAEQVIHCRCTLLGEQ